MPTTDQECLDALREAAERLGESPTKAAYEELGLTPASATIIRVVGGWNEAKERAGLETHRSNGSRVQPQPEHVEIPENREWEALSVDQRWHYKNRQRHTEQELNRRARRRQWLNKYKESRGCKQCGVADAAVLDFHHTDPQSKRMAINKMVTYGHGKDDLQAEIEKCEILCTNCHRKSHFEIPKKGATEGTAERRRWIYEYKRSADGCRRCGETDPACLVFHHHSGEKSETIASLVGDAYPKEKIRSEIKKCVLLCANCHRKEHFEPPEVG
jgi:hypothetical protein